MATVMMRVADKSGAPMMALASRVQHPVNGETEEMLLDLKELGDAMEKALGVKVTFELID